jgi:hypothetical protein
MKAKFLFIAILAAMFVSTQEVSAQTTTYETTSSTTTKKAKTPRKIRAFELELAGGIVSPTDKLSFDKNNLGWTAQGELRYNFKRLPLDLGVHVDGALFNREGKPLGSAEELKQLASAKFTSITGLGVIDLNILRTKGFSIFFGCGVGYGMLISDLTAIQNVQDIDQKGSFCVMPRAGIELFHHLRATFYYKHFEAGKNYEFSQNHYGVSLGVVFGGGKKKAKVK